MRLLRCSGTWLPSAAVGLALACGDDPGPARAETGSSAASTVGDQAASGDGDVDMTCQPLCSAPADCCPPPDRIPPGITCPTDFPFNFVCPDGVCRPGGCAGDGDCEYFVGSGRVCLTNNDVGLCVVACESEADCEGPPFGQSCTGVADDGATYCEGADPSSCDDTDQCDGMGTCIDGMCRCMEDVDCERGWGCTPEW